MVRKVLPFQGAFQVLFQGAFHDILSVHRLYLLNTPVSMYKIKKKNCTVIISLKTLTVFLSA